ncbi:MAG: hypothetical protein M3Q81_05270 [bacterium]|nr:hypothetical protein [bacterium]
MSEKLSSRSSGDGEKLILKLNHSHTRYLLEVTKLLAKDEKIIELVADPKRSRVFSDVFTIIHLPNEGEYERVRTEVTIDRLPQLRETTLKIQPHALATVDVIKRTALPERTVGRSIEDHKLLHSSTIGVIEEELRNNASALVMAQYVLDTLLAERLYDNLEVVKKSLEESRKLFMILEALLQQDLDIFLKVKVSDLQNIFYSILARIRNTMMQKKSLITKQTQAPTELTCKSLVLEQQWQEIENLVNTLSKDK